MTAPKLRPTTLDEIVGQAEAITELRLAVAGAKSRGETVGHILLVGPAGTGKTTIAQAIANETGGRLVPLFGVHLRNMRDVLHPLVLAERGDVLFVDEIHRMWRPVQEILFTVMEDGKLHLGKDGRGRVLDLPPLTIIGATTDPERLLTPMLDRFALVVQLRLYTVDELAEIATRTAKALRVLIEPEAAIAIGEAAEGVPRVTIRLVKAARDRAVKESYPMVKDGKATTGRVITEDAVNDVLASPALLWRSTGRDASG